MAARRDMEDARLEVVVECERGRIGTEGFVWGREDSSDWLATGGIVLELVDSGRRVEMEAGGPGFKALGALLAGRGMCCASEGAEIWLFAGAGMFDPSLGAVSPELFSANSGLRYRLDFTNFGT